MVEMGLCTAERVAEALDGQVLFGGRLGTNLLELGAVNEEALARALSRRHGTRALWGALLVDEHVLRLLRRELVDRLEVVPYALAGKRLSVLCCDPSDLARLDEVAFATGKLVEPVVVPEARLWAILRAQYALERPLRGLEVDWTRLKRAIPFEPGRVPSGPDLMGEEEFEALYGTGAGTGGPASTPASDRFGGTLVTDEEVLATLQEEASALHAGAARVEVGAPPRPPVAPLRFDEAVAALEGVQDRNAIARIVLRYARSRFRRAVLLVVHARGADGWEGLGEGLTLQAVARVHVPLDRPGVVRTVVQSRSHFLGPLPRTEANIRLLRALAGGAPRTSFAMPILARGRVVNVLYADDGRGGQVNPDGIGELLILAAKISRSYDVLLQRAK